MIFEQPSSPTIASPTPDRANMRAYRVREVLALVLIAILATASFLPVTHIRMCGSRTRASSIAGPQRVLSQNIAYYANLRHPCNLQQRKDENFARKLRLAARHLIAGEPPALPVNQAQRYLLTRHIPPLG